MAAVQTGFEQLAYQIFSLSHYTCSFTKKILLYTVLLLFYMYTSMYMYVYVYVHFITLYFNNRCAESVIRFLLVVDMSSLVAQYTCLFTTFCDV